MEKVSVIEWRRRLDVQEVSVAEVTDSYAQRIQQTNEALNSFITVAPGEQVQDQVEHAQREIDAGNAGALTGIPYAVKDLFCTRGMRTTAGSRILADYIPPYSSTAVARCADAVLLGKTNLDEFALGSSTEYSAFGPTHNPYDLSRVPGGTSGGSAAAVASGQVAFALGTDTGGSVRQPAAMCGVVGLKPTYGRISRFGVVAAASSLDTVGILAQTVADSAFVLSQLAGEDALDTTSPSVPVDRYMEGIEQGVHGMRVGIPAEFRSSDGVDPAITAQFEKVIQQLSALGAQVVDVSLPSLQYALASYYILNPSEVSSNLARYDGIQYGTPAPANSLEEVFLNTREQGFGPEAKRRILIGTFCLSSGYYDAYYKKAQQVRTLIRNDFDAAFQSVDFLLSPTSPVLPFPIGEKSDDPLAMYAADIFTVPVSLAGLPAVSVPVGFSDGLPVGVQCIGPQFQERPLLRAAYAIEQAFQAESPALVV